MFTSFDKAIVALIGAVIFLASGWLGLQISIPVETVQWIAGVITPILVWKFPNKK
jgi:uncharacterized membrane protein